jgi:hypothetical protein
LPLPDEESAISALTKETATSRSFASDDVLNNSRQHKRLQQNIRVAKSLTSRFLFRAKMFRRTPLPATASYVAAGARRLDSRALFNASTAFSKVQ